MKKLLILAIILAAVIFILPVATEFTDTTSDEGNLVTVTIPQGATADDIFEILKENGLVKNKLAFKLRLRLSSDVNVKYGSFNLNDGMCISDILKTISDPNNAGGITIVIPEGFSAENIASRLENSGLCTKEEFFDALNDSYDFEFIKYIPDGEYKYKLQGFLFPDTYTFTTENTPYEIVYTLLSNFDKKYRENIGEYDNTLFETIIKASLIERETFIPSERPTIAGVIENRLKIGQLLQIDASVLYGVTDGAYDKTVVTYKDLESTSKYNIYKYKGLPPGPIANPGIASVLAAKNPQKHDFYYYHTDTVKNDGSHIFTKTFDEHTNTMN